MTPTWQGGAGRERIGVKKIVQYTEDDKEVKTKKNQKDEGGEEPEKQKSLHYLGKIVEGKRLNTTIKAIDFSEVDSIRITTKITKKKRVGGSSTSYRFLGFSHNLVHEEEDINVCKNIGLDYYIPQSPPEVKDVMIKSYNDQKAAYIRL